MTPIALWIMTIGLLPQLIASPQALQVGEEVAFHIESHQDLAAPAWGGSRLVSRHEIHHPGASYIAPHFAAVRLEEGDFLVVRSPDDRRSWTYRPADVLDRPDGFWGVHIPGDRAIIELFGSGVPFSESSYMIDRYARGFRPSESGKSRPSKSRAPTRAICGTDDTEPAPCYTLSEPQIWDESRAVARLLIDGTRTCTGWLIGSEGHVMTNEHCVGSQAEASATTVEFMAEGGTCETDCDSYLACPGVIASTFATLIQANADMDYSLLKLPNNPIAQNGYLRLRKSSGVADERIYLPQHPGGWGKRIAVESTDPSDESGFAELSRTLDLGSTTVWLYYADTVEGTSGAPVIGYSDHQVVALHSGSFGTPCVTGNGGTMSELLIADLGAELPNDGVLYDLSVTLSGGGSGTVTSADGGIDCENDCEESYGNGTTVTLTAAPDAGSVFQGWSGGGCSGTGTCVVDINSDVDVEATFETPMCTLAVSKAGSGSGVVTSVPSGIDCGSDCTETYACGTEVTLNATPDNGSIFQGWSGDPDCADGVVTAGDLSCTATFDPAFTLTVEKGGSGTGTVTSSPIGIDCGADCQEVYTEGTIVTLAANPDASSSFSGWSGDTDCEDGIVTLNADTSCTATFELKQHTLMITKTGSGTGTVISVPMGIDCGVDCAEVYDHGTFVALTAIGDFWHWLGAADCLDGVVEMTDDRACTIEFVAASEILLLDGFESGDCLGWPESVGGCS